MHEIGIMNNVLDTALSLAERNGGGRVKNITLCIGIMSGIIPHYCHSMLEFLSKGTAAADCEFCFEEKPAVFKCGECGEITSYNELASEYFCAHCGSKALQLVGGFEARIESVTIS